MYSLAAAHTAAYGARVHRLQGASLRSILDEEHCFALFVAGAYGEQHETRDHLHGVADRIVAAAKQGDEAHAHAALAEFLEVSKVTASGHVAESTD